jgi:anti-anti-sigma regulatory factor
VRVSDLKVEPSEPAGDAPCPRCGHLLWFVWEDLGDTQVIKLTGGRLDAELWDRLMDSVNLYDHLRLGLDFSEVQYFSSEILAKLINLKKKLRAARRELNIRHLHPDLAEVFRITRLDQVLGLEP